MADNYKFTFLAAHVRNKDCSNYQHTVYDKQSRGKLLQLSWIFAKCEWFTIEPLFTIKYDCRGTLTTKVFPLVCFVVYGTPLCSDV